MGSVPKPAQAKILVFCGGVRPVPPKECLEGTFKLINLFREKIQNMLHSLIFSLKSGWSLSTAVSLNVSSSQSRASSSFSMTGIRSWMGFYQGVFEFLCYTEKFMKIQQE
ncbi:hypothetical protein HCR_07050 [Hydrogenimonas cancrithermarum]|uniref:Uncharacterized protein n=1 Tax=Hydrogenimonas cancrithermarum TaxID=2993563 RepID=A0ABN6WTV0_9BACT|nr:hypothetical protein HCR_07050 [Hydrogenimonas cancrithermarum]